MTKPLTESGFSAMCNRMVGVALAASVIATTVTATWILFSGVPFVRGADLNVVYTLVKWMEGGPLYGSPSAPPFDVAQYGPLYYVIARLVVSVLGGVQLEPGVVVGISRSVSAVFGAGALAAIALLGIHGFHVDRWTSWATAAVGLVLTFPWMVVARPDALVALLQLLAVATLCAASTAGVSRTRQTGLFIGAAFIVAAAVFAKQTAVISIAILGLVAWRERSLAVALGLMAVSGVVVAGGYGVVGVLWPNVFENVVTGINNGVTARDALLKAYPVILLENAWIPALALILIARRPGYAFGALGALSVSFWLHLVWGVLTALKDGSAENYFTESILLGLLLAAVSLAQRPDKGNARGRHAAALPDLRDVRALILIVVAASLPLRAIRDFDRYWWSKTAPNSMLEARRAVPGSPLGGDGHTSRLVRKLQQELRDNPDRFVLSFDQGVTLALGSRSLVPQHEVAEVLLDRGLVDYSSLLALGGSGRVYYLVHDGSMWGSFLGLDLDEYVEAERFGELRLYTRNAEVSAR